MNGTELLQRVSSLGWLRKRFKSIQRFYVAYMYYREEKKIWKLRLKKKLSDIKYVRQKPYGLYLVKFS